MFGEKRGLMDGDMLSERTNIEAEIRAILAGEAPPLFVGSDLQAKIVKKAMEISILSNLVDLRVIQDRILQRSIKLDGSKHSRCFERLIRMH
jgi:hypothetical protein